MTIRTIEMAQEQIDQFVLEELKDALERCIQDGNNPIDLPDCLLYIKALKGTLRYFMIENEYNEYIRILEPHTYMDYMNKRLIQN